jgi:hypothetical protein
MLLSIPSTFSQAILGVVQLLLAMLQLRRRGLQVPFNSMEAPSSEIWVTLSPWAALGGNGKEKMTTPLLLAHTSTGVSFLEGSKTSVVNYEILHVMSVML